jgi:hypothetical protein
MKIYKEDEKKVERFIFDFNLSYNVICSFYSVYLIPRLFSFNPDNKSASISPIGLSQNSSSIKLSRPLSEPGSKSSISQRERFNSRRMFNPANVFAFRCLIGLTDKSR